MLVTVSLSSHSAPYSFEYTGSSSSLKIDLLIVNTIGIIIVMTIVTAIFTTLIKIDIVTTIVNTIVNTIVTAIVIVTWVVMGVLIDTDSIDNHNR